MNPLSFVAVAACLAGLAWAGAHRLAVQASSAPLPLFGADNQFPITGLTAGPHTLTVCKDTESGIGALRFVGRQCAALPPPALPRRRLEFVGDSITCGTGSGPPVHPFLNGGAGAVSGDFSVHSAANADVAPGALRRRGSQINTVSRRLHGVATALLFQSRRNTVQTRENHCPMTEFTL